MHLVLEIMVKIENNSTTAEKPCYFRFSFSIAQTAQYEKKYPGCNFCHFRIQFTHFFQLV